MKSLLAGTALALTTLLSPGVWSQVSLTIAIAPPPLPLYAQPPVPGDGYIWTPGYWAWSGQERDYYWVPGTWVLAPNAGDLWTPGYWAFEDAGYFWHIGYWGPQVGFYGGVNYGYGYTGSGYQGGRWDHGAFRYNRAASNVDPRVVHNAYNTAVVGGSRPTHTSYNGGSAGTPARPTVGQRRFQSAEHAGPSAEQVQHEHAAVTMPTQRASGPHGVPLVAATPMPSAFGVPGVQHMRPEPAARPARPAGPEQREPSALQRPQPVPQPMQQPMPQRSAQQAAPEMRREAPQPSRMEPMRPEQGQQRETRPEPSRPEPSRSEEPRKER